MGNGEVLAGSDEKGGKLGFHTYGAAELLGRPFGRGAWSTLERKEGLLPRQPGLAAIGKLRSDITFAEVEPPSQEAEDSELDTDSSPSYTR